MNKNLLIDLRAELNDATKIAHLKSILERLFTGLESVCFDATSPDFKDLFTYLRTGGEIGGYKTPEVLPKEEANVPVEAPQEPQEESKDPILRPAPRDNQDALKTRFEIFRNEFSRDVINNNVDGSKRALSMNTVQRDKVYKILQTVELVGGDCFKISAPKEETHGLPVQWVQRVRRLGYNGNAELQGNVILSITINPFLPAEGFERPPYPSEEPPF